VLPPDVSQANGRALDVAADLSHALAQVQDFAGLQAVIGRIAKAIDASGVIVWLGSATGDDLRPIVAHGYSDKVIQLLPPVPVTADNAAAAAYRSASLQIIPERPGVSLGALVAPLVSADGCIGALAAEIRKGGETSTHVQALATIFASQLAGVLSASATQGSGVRVAR
jgi:GAF domain-containing protein